MKAVVCQNSQLSLCEYERPRPQSGQVLLKVLRCGICGSDLHLKNHCNHMAELGRRVGYPHMPSQYDAVVFGHEFCGEVTEYGNRTRQRLKPGTKVCAVPLLRRNNDIDLIGISANSGGAYAEYVAVEESLMEAIPNGLSPDIAALTEPMAVALHAVRRSEVQTSDVAIVIGCGPVGLAVICMLKAQGVKTIIASDFSMSRRRLAELSGADIVINPAEESPFSNWHEFAHLPGLPDLLELNLGTREKLGKLPVPWWITWQLAEKVGLNPKRPVIFECVGVPGILKQLMDGAPLMSRIVVVGVCMQADNIEPAIGINKELELRFVLGYSALEFRQALHLLADGKVQARHLVTGVVGLSGVAEAFNALADPEVHAKILIDPSMEGESIRLV